MKTQQRTPGPWELVNPTTIKLPESRNGLHGYISAWSGLGHETDKANARLIATAPDLARELHNLIFCLEAVHREFPQHYETSGCPDISKNIAFARAALASAGIA